MVLRSQAAHVAVLNAENAMDALRVVEQPGDRSGMVVAAFRPEVLNIQRVARRKVNPWLECTEKLCCDESMTAEIIDTKCRKLQTQFEYCV